MRAGELNRRLTLQRVVMTSDSEGVSSESWTTVDTIWGHINPISASEFFQAAQTEEKISHEVTIRWRPDITPKMRFSYVSATGLTPRIFLIHTIRNPDEEDRQLDCLCEEFITVEVGAT